MQTVGNAAKLKEMRVVNTNTSASDLALYRTNNQPAVTGPNQLLGQGRNIRAQASATIFATTWSTPPTISATPVVAIKRSYLASTGNGEVWTFRGDNEDLLLEPGGGGTIVGGLAVGCLVLWNVGGANSATRVSVVFEE
jgi:hypothetical protein